MVTTHIAGPSITVNGRTIQRCMVCGLKLVDTLGMATPLRPDGTLPELPTWRVDDVVEVYDGNPVSYHLLGHGDDDNFEYARKVPPNLCIGMIE
jgi:hypothetical protein